MTLAVKRCWWAELEWWHWSWELKWTELDPLDGRAERKVSCNFPGRIDGTSIL